MKINLEQNDLICLEDLNTEVILDHLKQKGMLWLRGSHPSLEIFEQLSQELITPMIHHATSTIERDAVNADGTTSTVNNGQDAIPLHREGSYAPGCPDLLMLYCVAPARQKGQTIVCDGVALLENLPAPIRSFVEQATLQWHWQAPPQRWQATLACDSQPEALKKLDWLQSSLPAWEQLTVRFEGDHLTGMFTTPCTIPTRWECSQSFCNSLLIHYFRNASQYFALDLFQVTLLDGSPFPIDILQQISTQAEHITHEIDWQMGDIAIIDNSRWMHGRRGFEDSQRRVLIRMGHLIP